MFDAIEDTPTEKLVEELLSRNTTSLISLIAEANAQTKAALALVDEAKDAAAARAKYELLRTLIADIGKLPTYQTNGEMMVKYTDVLNMLDRYVKEL
jgi:hypothetical protein